MSKHSKHRRGANQEEREPRRFPKPRISGGGDRAVAEIAWWRAGFLADPVNDAVFLWAVVALLVVSRWLAFPASIWDMDEANFALGVLHFDPVHNQPHAPFFPLWIGLGKVAHWTVPGIAPGGALGLMSAVFSVLVFFPLVWLWSMVIPRAQAIGAAVLYLALPGPWLLSGRAYSEPAATAFLITTVALWLPRELSRKHLAAGGVSLAAAVLVRPQMLIVMAPFVIWRVLRARGWADRALVLGVPAAIGTVAVIITVTVAGGLSPLWEATAQHRKYIAGAAEGFEWTFSEFCLHAASGGLGTGMLWLSLTLLGMLVLLDGRDTRRAAGVLVGLVLTPIVVLLLTNQNPTLPRYALPIMALTCGAVVAGIARIISHPRWTVVAVAGWILVSIVMVAPVLGPYRNEPSPVVAAFDHLERNPRAKAVAVDRQLIAFVTLERAMGGLRQQLFWDYQIELGMVESSFRPDLAAIFAGSQASWVAQPGEVARYSCDHELLREVASPRFLDLTVVEGCSLVQPEHPSVRTEDLRPKRVIPAE